MRALGSLASHPHPPPHPSLWALPLVAKRKAGQGPQHPTPGHPQLWQAVGLTCWATPPSTCSDLAEGAATSVLHTGGPWAGSRDLKKLGLQLGKPAPPPGAPGPGDFSLAAPKALAQERAQGQEARRAGWGLPRASALQLPQAEGRPAPPGREFVYFQPDAAAGLRPGLALRLRVAMRSPGTAGARGMTSTGHISVQGQGWRDRESNIPPPGKG